MAFSTKVWNPGIESIIETIKISHYVHYMWSLVVGGVFALPQKHDKIL